MEIAQLIPGSLETVHDPPTTSTSADTVPSLGTVHDPPTTSASAETVPSMLASVDASHDVVSSPVAASDVIASISPYPKSSRERQRKRKCETAQVLTSSPCKMRLLERAEKAAMKFMSKKTKTTESQEKKKKKKVTCMEKKAFNHAVKSCPKIKQKGPKKESVKKAATKNVKPN